MFLYYFKIYACKARSIRSGLCVSGQDIFSCGVAGALHGGLLCASSVLSYPVYIDLLLIKKKLKRKKAAEKLAKQKKQ